MEMDDRTETGSGEPAAAAPPPAEPAAEPQTFADMGLDQGVMQALDEMGFTAPMDVQRATWRPIMAGRDIMVQSRTGSGKTAAFGIPFAMGLVSGDEKRVQALVLCPTRELALQVAGEIGKIGAYKNLTVVPVYGGAPMGRQIQALKEGAQIVAGTPGRVLDHLRRGTFDPSGLKALVLDECDEMLSMGFQEEIENILARLPKERQTLLFSATIPEDIERIARRHMRDPLKLSLSSDFVGVYEIAHTYYLISGLNRPGDLLRILEYEQPPTALIFCNTREDTAMVAGYLRRHGFDSEAISGDLGQSDRERVMQLMKTGKLRFLVATDIAARGIDITDLPCVINYTFPESPEIYIHRTGRTGRAGKHGVAISLVAPQELGNFYYLKLLYKIRPEERDLPSEGELRTRREGERYDRLRREVMTEPGDEWRSLARRIWQSGEGERIIGELLKRTVETMAPHLGSVSFEPPPEARPSQLPERRREGKPRREREERPPREPAETPVERAAEGARNEARPERGRGPRPERGDRRRRGGEHREGESAAPRDREGGRRRERGERGRGRPEERPAAPARPPEEHAGGTPRPPEEHAGAPGSASTPSGTDFWETWVDERARGGAEPARPERRAEEEAPQAEPGTTRLYLNLGRRDRVRSDEVQQLLTERVGLAEPPRMQVRNTHTYLIVKDVDAERVIKGLTGTKYADRELLCEPARGR
jgi:ATP-dependent RNA helicase DeaD